MLLRQLFICKVKQPSLLLHVHFLSILAYETEKGVGKLKKLYRC